MVDIADLQRQREDLVKKRDVATKLATAYGNSDLGRFKAEESKRLESAIAGLDEALNATDDCAV
jgi:phage shock protein A